MPYSLNVWIYECASQVPIDVAVSARQHILRILNWHVVGVRPKYEYFMSTIFSQSDCSNLVPTPEELATLDLLAITDIPTNDLSSSSTRSASPHQHSNVRIREQTGFEDFFSEPSVHLLHKSKRLQSTTSPPPSKKRKAEHVQKTIPATASKSKKLVQFSESPTKKSSQAKPSDATKSSPGHSKGSSSEHIKQVKKFVKKYVD